MKNLEQQNHDALLNEILPLPANKTLTDRFAVSEFAGCSGKCQSPGGCMA